MTASIVVLTIEADDDDDVFRWTDGSEIYKDEAYFQTDAKTVW